MGECMYVHLENDYDDLVTNTNWHDDMIPNKCQHEKSKISQCEKKKNLKHVWLNDYVQLV